MFSRPCGGCGQILYPLLPEGGGRYALAGFEEVEEVVRVRYAHELAYLGYGPRRVHQQHLGVVETDVDEVVVRTLAYVALELARHVVLADAEML